MTMHDTNTDAGRTTDQDDASLDWGGLESVNGLAALVYARDGLRVFPIYEIGTDGECACGGLPNCSPGKHPRTPRGYHDATTDAARIQQWWTDWPGASIGIALASSGIVDVAPDSPEWLAEFQQRGLPTTAVYQSPGGDGHRHHFFRRPRGCPTARACRSGEYDVLSDGYAIVPPSVGAGRRLYTWIGEFPSLNGTLPDAPAWVVDLLKEQAAQRDRRREQAQRTLETIIPLPPPAASGAPPVPLFGQALAVWQGREPKLTADGRIDRSASLLKIGRELYNAGLDRAGVTAALIERDQTLGWNKYTGRGDAAIRYAEIVDELETEGRPARVVLGGVRAVGAGADSDDRDGHDAPANDRRHYEIIDAPDYVLRPPLRWLVPGLIPEQAFVCILGQPGAFKSFVALDLLASIAAGIPFQGFQTRPGACLYIAGEGAGGFGKRLQAWQQHRQTALPRTLKILPQPVPLTNLQAVVNLIADIKSFDEPFSAVVIDTLSRAMPGADENASKDMTAAVAAAQLIQQELGCAVIILHHGTKQDGTIRGHSSLPGALETIIRVQADRDGIITVSCDKQKDGQDFKTFYLRRVVVEVGYATPVDAATLSVEGVPTSVALERLSTEEEELRRGERKIGALSRGQHATLLRLVSFGAVGASRRAWLEACRLENPDLHRQSFKQFVDVLLSRGLVTETGAGDERFYTATGQAMTALRQGMTGGEDESVIPS